MTKEDKFTLQVAAKVISSDLGSDAKAAALVFFNSDDFSVALSAQVKNLLSEAYIATVFGYDYKNYEFSFSDENGLRQKLIELAQAQN